MCNAGIEVDWVTTSNFTVKVNVCQALNGYGGVAKGSPGAAHLRPDRLKRLKSSIISISCRLKNLPGATETVVVLALGGGLYIPLTLAATVIDAMFTVTSLYRASAEV